MHRLSSLLLAGLGVVATAPASIVTVNYYGTIAFSTLTSVPVGTAIIGSFTYDTTATGTLVSGSIQYTANGGTVQVGSDVASSPTGLVEVANDLPSGVNFIDRVRWTGTSPLTLPPAMLAESVSTGLSVLGMSITTSRSGTTPPTALSSTTPPDPFPVGFALGNFGLGSFVLEISDGTPGNRQYAVAEVRFGAVPEPSSLAMAAIGAGLIALGFRRNNTSVQ